MGYCFKDTAQLFWSTSRLPESESTSAHFEVMEDGQWHEYKVPLSQNRRWRGIITRLRLDPCDHPGVRVEVGSIRLQQGPIETQHWATGLLGYLVSRCLRHPGNLPPCPAIENLPVSPR
jgi:hypothetical protein